MSSEARLSPREDETEQSRRRQGSDVRWTGLRCTEVCFGQKAVVQEASFEERKVVVVKESNVAVRDEEERHEEEFESLSR